MDYATMTITEIAQLPGVKDLPGTVIKGKFALALKAEAEGNHAKAYEHLLAAIEHEQKMV